MRLTITGLSLIAAAVIASLTIGKDIYYGSRSEGLLSFAIVNFSGCLFFLFMPVEIAFVYYVDCGKACPELAEGRRVLGRRRQ